MVTPHQESASKTQLALHNEKLESIADSVKAAVAAGREAMVDCEHFFDGYKANPAYALDCAQNRI